MRRQNRCLFLATQKDRASHDHGQNPAPKRKKTSKLPENLEFKNFHELLEVAESQCAYCRNQSLKTQYLCIQAKYLEWKSWHSRDKMSHCSYSPLPNYGIIWKFILTTERRRMMKESIMKLQIGLWKYPHYSSNSITANVLCSGQTATHIKY